MELIIEFQVTLSKNELFKNVIVALQKYECNYTENVSVCI